RLGELHALKQNVILHIAQGLTSSDFFEAHYSSDVASDQLFELSTVVGVHLQDTTNTLALAFDGVVNGIARAEDTGVHTYESQLTYEVVGHELERQSRHGGFVVSRTRNG